MISRGLKHANGISTTILFLFFHFCPINYLNADSLSHSNSKPESTGPNCDKMKQQGCSNMQRMDFQSCFDSRVLYVVCVFLQYSPELWLSLPKISFMTKRRYIETLLKIPQRMLYLLHFRFVTIFHHLLPWRSLAFGGRIWSFTVLSLVSIKSSMEKRNKIKVCSVKGTTK